jgi:hypothetical protein
MANEINHAEYQRKVRKMETASLLYIIKDCQEAMRAMPDNPKNGFYADEINYAASELHRRRTVTK